MRAVEVEHSDLVPSLRQPRAGHEQPFLRAGIPEASEIVAVDPDKTFLPPLHIEVGVTRRFQVEATAEESGRLNGVAGSIGQLRKEAIIHRQGKHIPVHQRDARERDPFRDPLPVDQAVAEIDAAHRVDKDVERGTLTCAGRDLEGILSTGPVDAADELSIEIDARVVMNVGDDEFP